MGAVSYMILIFVSPPGCNNQVLITQDQQKTCDHTPHAHYDKIIKADDDTEPKLLAPELQMNVELYANTNRLTTLPTDLPHHRRSE